MNAKPPAQKKTSGGVAPIHLRKCATAKKPLESRWFESNSVIRRLELYRSLRPTVNETIRRQPNLETNITYCRYYT